MFRLRICRPQLWTWQRWLLLGAAGCFILHLLPILEIWREKRIADNLRQEGIACGFRNVLYETPVSKVAAVEHYLRWAIVPCSAHFPYQTDVQATAISQLRSLPFLESLEFGRRSWSGTRPIPRAGRFVDDSDLQEVGRLTQLRALSFHYSNITDEGLMHLSKLRRLRVLSLTKTGISDAGLIHVGRLTSLRKLSLQQTNVTGAGLKYLASLKELKWLSLQCTPLECDSLTALAALPNLQSLDLDLIQINDESIDTLVSLTSLKKLSLTKISDQGLDRLRRAMPNCVVVRDSSLP